MPRAPAANCGRAQAAAIGQPQPLDVNQPRASGQLQPSRDAGIGGFFTDPHQARLHDPLRLHLLKETFKRSRRVLELDRPDTSPPTALARQQTVIRKAPHRLAKSLTRHTVNLDQP